MIQTTKFGAFLMLIAVFLGMEMQAWHYQIKNSLNFNGKGETLGEVRIYVAGNNGGEKKNFKPGDVISLDTGAGCMDGFDIYPGGYPCDDNCKKNNPVAERLGERVFYRPGQGNFPSTSYNGTNYGMACRNVVGEIAYDKDGFIVFREGGATL